MRRRRGQLGWQGPGGFRAAVAVLAIVAAARAAPGIAQPPAADELALPAPAAIPLRYLGRVPAPADPARWLAVVAGEGQARWLAPGEVVAGFRLLAVEAEHLEVRHEASGASLRLPLLDAGHDAGEARPAPGAEAPVTPGGEAAATPVTDEPGSEEVPVVDLEASEAALVPAVEAPPAADDSDLPPGAVEEVPVEPVDMVIDEPLPGPEAGETPVVEVLPEDLPPDGNMNP